MRKSKARRRRFLGFAAMVSLVTAQACATNPERAVFDAEQGYDAAVNAATIYAKLPRCNAVSGPICSDQSVVNSNLESLNAAWNRLQDTESAVQNGTASVLEVQSVEAAIGDLRQRLEKQLAAIQAKGAAQ